MDPKSPLKTIEVIDARTGNACKVACMSCIRGHRTTSCGKTVCRTKLFWTVKRPGRPANACTCPLGSTGRCQCVIATSACTHRPKKGESRPVDCRCDEQGRWCCVLLPEHWSALSAHQSPRVDFYPNPELLNAARTISSYSSVPSTPAFSTGTPQTMNSLPSTPGPMPEIQPLQMDISPLTAFQTPTYQIPRFGLMGTGSPLGNDGYIGEDVLKWGGQAPQAPRELQPFSEFDSMDLGAVPTSTAIDSNAPSQFSFVDAVNQQYQNIDFNPVTQSLQDMTVEPHNAIVSQLQQDKWMEDYYHYQFPGAICQNCGLGGCNCRVCPAVMQSSVDGSWAQCCSRKHVRTADIAQRAIDQVTLLALGQGDSTPFLMTDQNILRDGQHVQIPGLQPGGDQPLAPELHDTVGLSDSVNGLDFKEFLMLDPEPPSHGCCCGSET